MTDSEYCPIHGDSNGFRVADGWFCRTCTPSKKERQAIAHKAEHAARERELTQYRIWYETMPNGLSTTLVRHVEPIPKPGTVPQASKVQQWDPDTGRWLDVTATL
jgi:hypothetical protein